MSKLSVGFALEGTLLHQGIKLEKVGRRMRNKIPTFTQRTKSAVNIHWNQMSENQRVGTVHQHSVVTTVKSKVQSGSLHYVILT